MGVMKDRLRARSRQYFREHPLGEGVVLEFEDHPGELWVSLVQKGAFPFLSREVGVRVRDGCYKSEFARRMQELVDMAQGEPR
ncbi:MAG: hypothetical protein ACYTAO_17775 [Planctomycetota bacterium]|jgi:hypothetical protein